jgi:hypothetical protein
VYEETDGGDSAEQTRPSAHSVTKAARSVARSNAPRSTFDLRAVVRVLQNAPSGRVVGSIDQPAARSARVGGVYPVTTISSAAKRWSGLWNEVDARRATVLARGNRVSANKRGLRLDLVPMLVSHHGRHFISIGIQYDNGTEAYRALGSPGLGQLVNLPFSDWAIADQLWGLLEVGDFGVSFSDLDAIDGGFDRESKAWDHAERDSWVQRVWELKLRLEENAKSHTWAALTRVAGEIRARLGTEAVARAAETELPASLLAPLISEEASTRFRINQGMYGDHSYFIERPWAGRMLVRPIPVEPMLQRAADLRRELTDEWLSVFGQTLNELSGLTAGKEGAALARAIESADVARKLNLLIGTFWTMWKDPMFSPNADFEVVTDPQRRAAKYMEVMIQRTFRILIKQAVEGIGQYPYPGLDRFSYIRRIRSLEEAVNRARRILDLYASSTTLSALRQANAARRIMIDEFQARIVTDRA